MTWVSACFCGVLAAMWLVPQRPSTSLQLTDRDLRSTPDGSAYEIVIFDSHDEDGDVVGVRIHGSASSRRVNLTNRGERFYVNRDQRAIDVTAMNGGFGHDQVSVAIRTPGGGQWSRLLREGDVVTIPLSFR